MRIVDAGRGRQRLGLNLFVTRQDAQRFLEELRSFLVHPSGAGSRTELVDNGPGENPEVYRTRRLVLFKIDPEDPESEGWQREFLDLIRDDEAAITQVSLVPPRQPS